MSEITPAELAELRADQAQIEWCTYGEAAYEKARDEWIEESITSILTTGTLLQACNEYGQFTAEPAFFSQLATVLQHVSSAAGCQLAARQLETMLRSQARVMAEDEWEDKNGWA